MKRAYTEAPADWDVAQRDSLTPARRAYAMEGPPRRRGTPLARMAFFGAAVLVLVVIGFALQ